MLNVFFELDRLRSHLSIRGIDEATIDNIVSKASAEIDTLVKIRGESAIEEAVQIGAEKESADFINELRLDLHIQLKNII